MLNFYYTLDFANKPHPRVAYNLVEESDEKNTNHIKHCLTVPSVNVCCYVLFCLCHDVCCWLNTVLSSLQQHLAYDLADAQ